MVSPVSNQATRNGETDAAKMIEYMIALGFTNGK
jgi:hypothetical protein